MYLKIKNKKILKKYYRVGLVTKILLDGTAERECF